MSTRTGQEWKPRRSRTRTYSRGQETEDRLLDSVLRIVSTRGAAAVSHRAVAEDAGVALSATTYYFRDKAEYHNSYFIDPRRSDRLVKAPMTNHFDEEIKALIALQEGVKHDSSWIDRNKM